MLRVAILAGCALVLAGCGGSTTHHHAVTGRLPSGSQLVRVALETPAEAYAAGASLYTTDVAAAAEHTADVYELTRIAVSSGRVLAVRRFDAAVDDVLLTRGSLWVTTSSSYDTTLWRLSPTSLAVLTRTAIPTTKASEAITGSLAVAGGWLWVGAGQLVRVSPASGAVRAVVHLRYSGPVELAGAAAGGALVAVAGYQSPIHVLALDPRTGALRAARPLPASDSVPAVGGIIDGGLWLANTSGGRTAAMRIELSTLEPTPTSVPTATRIAVRVLDGVVWVTEPSGEKNLNDCANPVSGRALETLPPLPGDSVLLTADAATLFYTDVPVNAHSVKLERAPISAGCRA